MASITYWILVLIPIPIPLIGTIVPVIGMYTQELIKLLFIPVYLLVMCKLHLNQFDFFNRIHGHFRPQENTNNSYRE